MHTASATVVPRATPLRTAAADFNRLCDLRAIAAAGIGETGGHRRRLRHCAGQSRRSVACFGGTELSRVTDTNGDNDARSAQSVQHEGLTDLRVEASSRELFAIDSDL
jgi:hypothetical protein